MPAKTASTIVVEIRSDGDRPEPKPSAHPCPFSLCLGDQPTNMTNTLRTHQVRTLLDRLFATAANDDDEPQWRKPGISWEDATAQERADAAESIYMPISRQGGELLYILGRAKRPNTIVEFGTSYGISTVYLAASVADNRMGHVVSTELNRAKAAAARANLAEAGLADHVTILPGDAMTTLKELSGSVDLVLLDGWKDMCLPVLRSLESRLTSGALIVADDINLPSLTGYLEYVRDPANGYTSVSFPIEDGMEISCWTADGLSDEKGAL